MALAQASAPELLPEVFIVAVRASVLQQANFLEVELLAFLQHLLGRPFASAAAGKPRATQRR